MGFNNVTGDSIFSKASKNYADNYDAIFKKDKPKDVSPTPDVGAGTSPEQGTLPRHSDSAVQHFVKRHAT